MSLMYLCVSGISGPHLSRSNLTCSCAFAGASGRPSGALGAVADGEQVELALFPSPPAENASSSAASEPLGVLPKPYIRAPGSMTTWALRSWLSDRLAGKKADAFRLSLQLECAGRELDLAMTLQQVHDTIWKVRSSNGTQPTAVPSVPTGVSQAVVETSTNKQDHPEGKQTEASSTPNRVMVLYYRREED